MQILPLIPSVRQYTFDTVLDENPYVVRVTWNDRDEAWYLDIADADRVAIAYGIKVVLGANLGRVNNHKLFDNGALLALDRSGENREAAFDDLGDRVLVVYVTGLELAGALVEGQAL